MQQLSDSAEWGIAMKQTVYILTILSDGVTEQSFCDQVALQDFVVKLNNAAALTYTQYIRYVYSCIC